MQIEVKNLSDEHQMKTTELSAKVEEAQLKLDGERQKLQAQEIKLLQEIEKSRAEIVDNEQNKQFNENTGNIIKQLTDATAKIGSDIAAINTSLTQTKAEMKSDMDHMKTGMGIVMQEQAAKKKPVGFALKKDSGKTKAVSVEYADGTSEDMPVMVK